jgi:ATP-dependent helicase HrpA
LRFPEHLPVVARREDLLAALRDHQVVVVAGETGSGKTTQLPKLCLELGRGVAGTIGHTQPRRIAARAVAERLADELGTTVGADDHVVTYKVRFTERGIDRPLVRVMTDGVLLAEIHSDPLLRRYDTLIIDEAHERSLTIDFLLGYVRSILPKRPDLKVVITSATIDPARFADHFADGGARTVPVVEVSGRTYPVELRYRPPADDTEPADAICDALTELGTETPGDVLVFLSGEREIRDTQDAVTRFIARTPRWLGTEVIPLYGRLSAAEQHAVFEDHRARRIVLATNVAETSLTVPGIRYVIDPGTARISRYSNRLKVQRLPIEPISQASADQRAGRCGRVADGICIRLYDEDDYLARPRFTDPEILRTHLSAVILRMAALDLGRIEEFGFLDPPDPRAVKDGLVLLRELNALAPSDDGDALTATGRHMARLPLDPRLARMLVAAAPADVLDEVVVLAAALTIQDPRETPGERGSGERRSAEALHARFADPTSDLVAWLNLWDHLEQEQRGRSRSGFRRMCRDEHLHYLRIREWQDLVAQLRSVSREIGLSGTTSTSTHRDLDEQRRIAVHQAVLTGLLSHIGLRTEDKRDYLGARGARFALSPGSALFTQPPTWVMAAELVETTRLWAHHNARIEPEWIEPAAEHLVVRQHSEPRWSKSRGSAVATERVTLYGVPIVAARTVPLGRIDAPAACELFIRHGLVLGEWKAATRAPHFAFWRENRRLLDDASTIEDRLRRRGVVLDEEGLVEWYGQRVPANVVSLAHFERWWKTERRSQPDLLTLAADDVIDDNVPQDWVDDAFPVRWSSGDFTGSLDYLFDPTSSDDGVTATVSLQSLPGLTEDAFSGATVGRRTELVAALIKSLPKHLRRHFVPAPDVAAVLAPTLPVDGALRDHLAHALQRRSGIAITGDDFDLGRVPPHLVPTIRVVDDAGHELARGKDIAALREQLREQTQEVVSNAATEWERSGLTTWTDAVIPRTVAVVTAAGAMTGYPALVDRGDHVDLRVLDTAAAQHTAHVAGVRRLLQLSLPSPIRGAVDRLDRRDALVLARTPYPSVSAMLDALVEVILDDAVARSVPWDAESFDRLRDHARASLADAVDDGVAALRRALERDAELGDLLERTRRAPAIADALDDLLEQRARLMNADFVRTTGWPQTLELSRYLQAMTQRLERLGGRIDRDRADLLMVRALEEDWTRAAGGAALTDPPSPALTAIRWQLEELRVSVFASTAKAKGPVSEKRVLNALAALDA